MSSMFRSRSFELKGGGRVWREETFSIKTKFSDVDRTKNCYAKTKLTKI